MNIGIVIPVFDDWPACARLLHELDQALAETGVRATVLLVDDGSTSGPDRAPYASLRMTVRLVELVCNLGNQRAIAVGLCLAQRDPSLQAVAVMDGDGEDRPEDLLALIERLRGGSAPAGTVMVARRDSRSEGPVFRAFYALYRTVFRALTGKPLRFGNFCLIPRGALDRLVYTPDIWNNLAAGIHRSRLPIEPVASARGMRYAGRSSTTLSSLVVHGLSSVSVYSDIVFARVLLGATITAAFALAGILVALAMKLLTPLTTPGWTTTVVGILAIIALQLVMLTVAASFLLLSSRTQAVMVPAMRAQEYVRAETLLTPPVADAP